MYNFKNWVDRVTQFVNRFKETNNSDGSITHERVDGEVLKTGTSRAPQTSTTWRAAFWKTACCWPRLPVC